MNSKILIVIILGDFYEEALIDGFRDLDVITFKFELQHIEFKEKIFLYKKLKNLILI